MRGKMRIGERGRSYELSPYEREGEEGVTRLLRNEKEFGGLSLAPFCAINYQSSLFGQKMTE